MITNEAIDGSNRVRFRFERFIFADERSNFLLSLASQNFADAFDAKFFDNSALLCCRPGFVSREFGTNRGPIRFRDGVLAIEDWFYNGGFGFRHGVGPCGIETLSKWQRLSSRDLGQRKAGNFSRGKRQIFRGEREIFLLFAIQSGNGARIERSKAAARKVILNLVFDGPESIGSGFSRTVERKDRRVSFGQFPPLRV